MQLRGTFEVTSWDEEAAGGLEGTVQVKTARIGQHYEGDLEAETVLDAVMTYRPDGTADYVGHQRVLGSVGGRSGSFVLRTLGTFDGSAARSAVEVVVGSGTGDFAEVTGAGSWTAPLGTSGTYELALDLEP